MNNSGYITIIQLTFLIMLMGCEAKIESGTKLSLPNGEGNIGIVCKYKSRAMTSEGQKRSLMLEFTGKEPVFFRYPETFAGDKTKINVYWYPKNSLLRFKDTMAKNHTLDAQHECVLGLGTLNLRYVVRDPNGTVYAATISQPYKKNPIDFSSGKGGDVFPNIDIAVASPYNPIIEGEDAPVAEKPWTSDEGVFLGSLRCLGVSGVTPETSPRR